MGGRGEGGKLARGEDGEAKGGPRTPPQFLDGSSLPRWDLRAVAQDAKPNWAERSDAWEGRLGHSRARPPRDYLAYSGESQPRRLPMSAESEARAGSWKPFGLRLSPKRSRRPS